MIIFQNNKFHLFNQYMSYVIAIDKNSELLNLHFGNSVCADEIEVEYGEKYFETYSVNDNEYQSGALLKECPTIYGDFRSPAIEIELNSGLTSLNLMYSDYEIIKGKPQIDGLPSVYVENEFEAETLKIITSDDNAGIEVYLYYTIFNDYNVICRHSEIKNVSKKNIFLKNAQSVSIDFPSGEYEFIHLNGAWAREKHVERCSVHKGTQGFESRRGFSGHVENPFMAFMEKGANESYGNVYGVSLVYSGNHKFLIESEAYETVRVQAGINPFNFKYKLEPNEIFNTPEAVLVFSGNGLAEMSKTFHKLYRTRLCRGKYRDSIRPILINNWEATYFNFNRNKLLDIADTASDMGIELFVLDDGWFGNRNDDKTSLGDWNVNELKLGGNLNSFVQEINNRGLKFGLWIEPEMISPDSELYKYHSDWAIKVPNQKPHLIRNQLVLDYTRKDVREYIVEIFSKILSSANIEYIKWDCNRYITDIYCQHLPEDRQGEFYHRYILGLYEVLEILTSTFPHILFEGCAGGGGRNDPGMLYYMSQNWASDDTDAVERLYIQYGSSFVYPMSTIGSHVSAVPNHQVGRITSLSMRGTVAMTGAFGYELDLSKLTDEEKQEVKAQVVLYKKIRSIITYGDYYRLSNPNENNVTAWMYVAEDKTNAVFSLALVSGKPNPKDVRIKLKGLNPNMKYSFSNRVVSGKTLMEYGLNFPGCGNENFNCTYVLIKYENNENILEKEGF